MIEIGVLLLGEVIQYLEQVGGDFRQVVGLGHVDRQGMGFTVAFR